MKKSQNIRCKFMKPFKILMEKLLTCNLKGKGMNNRNLMEEITRISSKDCHNVNHQSAMSSMGVKMRSNIHISYVIKLESETIVSTESESSNCIHKLKIEFIKLLISYI